MVDLSFSFEAECWLWHAENQVSWHFVTLPPAQSDEIKFFSENLREKKRGWGSVRVQVKVGESYWETSIFPYSKTQTYILPIKAEVRKKEKIAVGDSVHVSLKIAM